jgi:hypothetical protein
VDGELTGRSAGPDLAPAQRPVISASGRAAGELPLTIPALLGRQAAERASHPLLICDDETLTYEQADRQSAALAAGLLATGAGHGTHVAILYPNGPDFLVSWLAAARIGAVSFPLSTFSTDDELGHLLRRADIEVLLSAARYRSRDFVAALRAVAGGLDLATAPPVLDPGLPALRHVAFGAQGTAGWSRSALIEAGARVPEEVLAAPSRRPTGWWSSTLPAPPASPRASFTGTGRSSVTWPTSTRSAGTPATTSCSPPRRSSGSAASLSCCSPRWWPGPPPSAPTSVSPPECLTCWSEPGPR